MSLGGCVKRDLLPEPMMHTRSFCRVMGRVDENCRREKKEMGRKVKRRPYLYIFPLREGRERKKKKKKGRTRQIEHGVAVGI
jgi:hypothetical protein